MTAHKYNEKLSRAYAVESMIGILYREIDENWESQPFYLKLIMEALQKDIEELIKVCKDDDLFDFSEF